MSATLRSASRLLVLPARGQKAAVAAVAAKMPATTQSVRRKNWRWAICRFDFGRVGRLEDRQASSRPAVGSTRSTSCQDSAGVICLSRSSTDRDVVGRIEFRACVGSVHQFQRLTAASTAARIKLAAITPCRVPQRAAGDAAVRVGDRGKCRSFRSGGHIELRAARAGDLATGLADFDRHRACRNHKSSRYVAMDPAAESIAANSLMSKRDGCSRQHVAFATSNWLLRLRRRSRGMLSAMPIVRIFLVLPMDSVVGLLRIERLNLPARAAFEVSMDAAPQGGRAK